MEVNIIIMEESRYFLENRVVLFYWFLEIYFGVIIGRSFRFYTYGILVFVISFIFERFYIGFGGIGGGKEY